ncbi:MAG: phosphatidate cytidylyltransferase, partial [Treponema sp.]|nr:phosphatidate cytidylyltransferase [Treponema sp.]
GPLTLVLGIACAALLWKPQAATVGILALAFGDGLASLAGKFLGNLHIPYTGGKTCAGSLMCLIAIFISSFCVLQRADAALAIALCGMFLEVLPLKDFDNLLIPIVLGAMAQFL